MGSACCKTDAAKNILPTIEQIPSKNNSLNKKGNLKANTLKPEILTSSFRNWKKNNYSILNENYDNKLLGNKLSIEGDPNQSQLLSTKNRFSTLNSSKLNIRSSLESQIKETFHSKDYGSDSDTKHDPEIAIEKAEKSLMVIEEKFDELSNQGQSLSQKHSDTSEAISLKKGFSPAPLKRGSHGLFFTETTEWGKLKDSKQRLSYMTQGAKITKEEVSDLKIIADSNTSLLLYLKPPNNSSGLSEESEEKKSPLNQSHLSKFNPLVSISEKSELQLSPRKKGLKMEFPEGDHLL